jgi:transposase-like protein
MPRSGYLPDFRRPVLDLVASGSLARDLGISNQTIYTWLHQDRVNRGQEPGLSSAERLCWDAP